MIKRGITGELLSFDSIMNGRQIKTSSTVTSAKIGLQSLYANYEEMIEKYKDFDLVKEMISRKDSNLLWVRARAIDADVVNSNGDYFSEEELTKINDYQGKKLPAYKTFEGCPIYTNHKNDDIEEAKGMIVYAEWDDDKKCVFCVFFIDEDAYPELAHGIKQGYIHDVSMGCTVELGICSICGNKATTEKDYCDCLKKYKSKTHPSGKKAYESNYGIKFIELSAVGDGAFESCEVIELYDKEEVIYKSQAIVKAANALNKTMAKVAATRSKHDHVDIEESLKTFYSLNSTLIKCAQNAGNLVGGQLLGSGTAQNATVVKILQGLGIDPGSSLNILDLVNLALNFLEVAVLNLFSRKDNIDLAHVAKLTKAMGELQNTLQDMIDDGIEAGTSNQNPMFPGTQPTPQSPQAPPQPQDAAGAPGEGVVPPVNNVPPMQTQQALFEPSVGTMVAPFSQQPYALPIGGGVLANNIGKRIVWASAGNADEDEEIIFNKQNKFENFIFALENLRQACNIATKNSNKDMLEYPQKNKTASSGDKNYMDYFKKIANDAKKANTVALAIDVKIDDQKGNRVVLSTDKGISGFHNGKLTNWAPVLTDSQIAQMENGDGVRTASELLGDFSNVIKTAYDNNSIDVLMTLNENISSEHEHNEEPIVSGVNKMHNSNEDDGMQSRLDGKRTDGSTNENYNKMLEEKRTSALVRIVTELSKDARKNLGDETLESMINPSMNFSKVSGKKVVRNVLASIANTCEKTNSSPQSVIEFLSFCASNKDFPVVLKIARLGTNYRKYNALMSKTAQILDDSSMDEPMGDSVGTEILPVEETAVTDIADNVDEDATEGDIIAALTVIKDNFSEAVSQLDKILDNTAPESNKMDEMKDALSDDADDEDMNADAMKGAVTGLSLAGDDMNASGEDIVDTVNNIPADVMAAKINDFRKMSASKKAVASKADLAGSTLKWLADVAVENNIETDRITLAAKLLCSYRNSAINILDKSIKTSKIKVTDETFHGTTIEATLEEIGIDVQDASFNSKFRDIAVDILAKNGYEVDPTTFSLTDIQVTEDGMVCGKVSSRAVKTFTPSYNPNDLDYVDEDRNDIISDESVLGDAVLTEEASPIVDQDASKMIMSNGAKANARMARIKNVIKVAQGLGLPGAPQPAAGGGMAGMGGDVAGQIPPMDAGVPNAANELGVSSLTGASQPMADGLIDESPEPGTKSPWGTVCPQCGSKDVDVANGTGSCNSCNAQLEFKFIVEVLPSDDKNDNAPDDAPMDGMEAPMSPDMAMPPAAAAPAQPNPGNDMGMGGMQQAASNNRILIKGVYKTTADVYAGATVDGFNKRTAMKLPVGLVCPACGSREASKRENNTFCYACDTISHSSVKRIDGEPGMLEASIIWMN